MNFYYSHGRTAFKYGLIYLGLKKNDQILIPEYLCDVLLDPLRDLGIRANFYEINSDFTTNWNNLNKKKDKKIKALLFINYFGFEENKIRFKNFCKKRKIYLIEDSCHSLKLSNKYEKSTSDFIFYSTKKIIKNTYSGGILNINKKNNGNILFHKNLIAYKINLFLKLNFIFENNFLIIKRFLKYLLFKRPMFEKIGCIKNYRQVDDYLIDKYSKKILLKNNLQAIKSARLKNLMLWKKICLRNELIMPIKRKLKKNTIPWLYPVYVKDQILRKKIFLYGWKNGYSIISWPSLPKKLINRRNRKIWSKLVCFETDRAPRDLKKTNLF
jgi:hypothetical protein